jgi:hypothetical protein
MILSNPHPLCEIILSQTRHSGQASASKAFAHVRNKPHKKTESC